MTVSSAWRDVPILMYHAVESAQRPPRYKHFYVLASEFRGQMEALKRSGYQPIGFDLLADAQAGRAALPNKPVILTFDDGYANLVENVHPLLNALGFAYTVFLISGKVGGTNDWVADEGYDPTPLLTWPQIHAMRNDGVDFQAHTMSHPHLSRLSPQEIRHELLDSRRALEQELGASMNVLCYPYGDYSDAVVREARDSGYTMAVTTEFGRARRSDDPMLLPRVSVYHVPPISLSYGIASLNYRWRLESRKDTRPLPRIKQGVVGAP